MSTTPTQRTIARYACDSLRGCCSSAATAAAGGIVGGVGIGGVGGVGGGGVRAKSSAA